jgi:cyclopropane-fatty-acyl-phospholipid synthase
MSTPSSSTSSSSSSEPEIRSSRNAEARSWLSVLVDTIQPLLMPVVERNLVPDFIIRYGARKLLRSTLDEQSRGGDVVAQRVAFESFVADLYNRPIAESTAKANEQHYEVPSELYELMLGPHLKYSCGYWPAPMDVKNPNAADETGVIGSPSQITLQQSEEAMLNRVCERAQLEVGVGSTDKSKTPKKSLHILDLGCGWGSCGLYIAQRYPNHKVSMVSNSKTQREYILAKAKKKGLTNIVDVYTMDANTMTFPAGTFDRIVTNEMFEHMKNYPKFLKEISSWMKSGALLFIHIFTHKANPYHFENGWMADEFFSGGTMPSADLLGRFQDDLQLKKQWTVNGRHYSQTLEAWLVKLDEQKARAIALLGQTYGDEQALKKFVYWRLFHIACSECFALNGGNEWFVSHYLFAKQ